MQQSWLQVLAADRKLQWMQTWQQLSACALKEGVIQGIKSAWVATIAHMLQTRVPQNDKHCMQSGSKGAHLLRTLLLLAFSMQGLSGIVPACCT